MDEETFRTAVGKLAFLRGMAVDEHLIRSEVLVHVSQCCASLKELSVFSEFVDEDVASVICKSLPSLRKLEITESVISSQAIIAFIDGLKDLEHFDISGYENSAITDVVLQKASRLKVFIWNSRFELGEFMDCSNCGEDWLLQRSCECMLDRKVMEWLTELS
ncbi:F-box domain containing protein [Musa troglodytarum]|uniref:F-box domain containing protein n=1 Tax=Musa troglodytarum TaxID=320322 RepID=A0A9E7FH65_9LILI|nr:F-box domain containing protein [Musa troglodytarum]